MIRMVLFAIGFVVVTVTLVLFQPGSKRAAPDAPLPEPVTRAEPVLRDPAPTTLSDAIPQLLADPALRPAIAPTAPPSQGASLDDQSLRRMTWQTLSNLNSATGRDSAPGQPGSLLHTIVKRSLDETPNAPRPTGSAAPALTLQPALGTNSGAARPPATYVVKSGDSLISIAQSIYGDVNMTGQLFAANQGQLSRPDDLRPGQVLVLP
jgi:nucleoid-associated protein YgaU